jgi:hypothetical protein
MPQISVFRTSEQELNAFFATRIPRDPSRSGGLICYGQIEPIRPPWHGIPRKMSRRREVRNLNARNAKRTRAYRDMN